VNYSKILPLNITSWLYQPFAKYPDKTERLVYLLIFLFPIAGMSVRHWITNIFNILVLIALITLKKPREPLIKEEKIFLWICVSYFSMFILSSLVNGWEQAQTYYLGTELRFLMAIPLYLLIRRYHDSCTWLLKGAIVGGVFLISQALYDLYILNLPSVLGVYSKNLTGPFAVLCGFWSLYYISQNLYKIKVPYLIFILLSVIAAFTTAGLSGSRGSYVGFITTALVCVMFFSKPRWMFASLISIFLIAVLFYQYSSTVQTGIDKAKNEVQEYFSAEDHVTDKSSKTSSGVRLEMIRTSLLFIKDNPLTGIGPGNYNKSTKIYVDMKKASPGISLFSNPHNVFIEVACAKGLLGLITVLLLFYYPAYIFIKDYKKFKPSAIIGLIHIIAISIFSLTDHSVIVKNNYSSILLLGIIVFLANHFHAKKKAIELNLNS